MEQIEKNKDSPDLFEIKTNFKLHRKRAERFYKILRTAADDPQTLVIAFNLEKNQPLPKTPVGDAYYSRQLWINNLGFVIHTRQQKKQKVRIS